MKRRSSRERGFAAAAAIGAGALYAAAFPPLALWPLAWVALVPFLVVVRRGSLARAAGLAWLWSLVAAYGLNAWFPPAVSTYYLRPAWVGAAFFLGVTTLTATPAVIAFVATWRVLRTASPVQATLVGAAAWVATELLRVRVLGDPWGLLGYSQAGVGPVVQVATLGGVYAVGFLVALIGCALAEVWMRRDVRALGLAAAVVAAALVWGAWRGAAADGAPAGTPIVVVQSDPAVTSLWRAVDYGRNLDVALRLTADGLGAEAAARLAIWPESAMTFFAEDEPAYRTIIGSVLAPRGAELMAGGPRAVGGRPPYTNSAFLFAPDGSIRDRYDKRRLLPFAERFPAPWLDVARRRFGRVREFTAGTTARPLETSAGRAGVVICNEAFFAGPVGDAVRAGAEWIAVLANDAWLGSATYGRQALDMAVFRAVETGRWLVRVSTSGPSAVIDPAGRVVARTPTGAAAVMHARVVPRTEPTPYARVGDAFAALCVAIALGGMVPWRGRRGSR